MGLIHSRASKKRDKAEAKLLDEQAKAAKQQAKAADEEAKAAKSAAVAEKWEPIVAAIEAGEASWDDLTRMQKMSMPISYQVRCKSAGRRRGQ